MPSKRPLAIRMRPQEPDDIKGQAHILSPGSTLYKLIEGDLLSSIILYGPPGTGKTTIARVIANKTKASFIEINAVAASKKDIEAACKKAEKADEDGERTILFIDEIHRFNKAQQDYLLPYVERGIVILIGATTENPYFEVNNALLSRSFLFELKTVPAEDIKEIIMQAVTDDEKGIGKITGGISDRAASLIAEQAGGDVRHALVILEMAQVNAGNGNEIKETHVKAAIQRPHVRYDKNGDNHYDTASAFIKSMRGSDPDATLYYLARMIVAGEDPKFIARRIMICASEDVGNADPMALVIAVNASIAAERTGFPEARIILSQAALYVAMAPKSNTAYTGIDAAIKYVKNHPGHEIPSHLKDAHYNTAHTLGRGVGYAYPHDFDGHYVRQRYLPDGVNERFYKSSGTGHEKRQVDRLNDIIRKLAEGRQ